jgi:hypothetical protein
MTTKNQKTEGNDVATIDNANNVNLAIFDLMDDKPTSEMLSLTSNLIKMEEGENKSFFVHNEVEELVNLDGETYTCQVMTNREGERVLMADTVVLSNFKKLFDKEPSINGVFAKIICKGERKSAAGNKTYKDFSIFVVKA